MNARQVWRAALGELQLETSKANFETWLKNTVPVTMDRQRFVIGAPTTFAREWLEQRMLDQIGGTLRRLLARPIEVQIVVHQPGGSDGGDQSLWSLDEKSSPNGDGVRSNQPAEPTHRNGNGLALNPSLTFENFIVGNCNRLAHAAA
ncbi:MAG: chromosomal replication initiator protein DnaA, partial [Chloroflexi bacterium]|nr:chromosomal replication initiator protein DnaA [Chloroflexota bacterium]